MQALPSRRHDSGADRLPHDELAAMLALTNLSPADKAAAVALLLVSVAHAHQPFDLSSAQIAGLIGSTNGLDRLKSLVPKGYFSLLEHAMGKGVYRLVKGDWNAATANLAALVPSVAPLAGPRDSQALLFAEHAELRVVGAESDPAEVAALLPAEMPDQAVGGRGGSFLGSACASQETITFSPPPPSALARTGTTPGGTSAGTSAGGSREREASAQDDRPSTVARNPDAVGIPLSPARPEHSAGHDRWSQAKRELRKAGLLTVHKAVEEARVRGLTAGTVCQLARFYTRHREGFISPMVLRFVIQEWVDGSDPEDLSTWPPMLTSYRKRLRERERDAVQSREVTDREAQLAHDREALGRLEAAHGPRLDALGAGDVVALIRSIPQAAVLPSSRRPTLPLKGLLRELCLAELAKQPHKPR